MNTGQYISGIGHAGLIGWLLLGNVFAPAPEPFEVTEVAVVSPEEYERIVGAQQPPEAVDEAPQPPQPTEPVEPPQPEAQPETPPERPVPEPKPETPPQDDSPDVAKVLPPEPTEVEDTPPEIAPPPQEDVVIAPKESVRPKPRPAPRVAPEPVAQPEPEAKPDDVTREEVRKDEAGDVQKDETEATAPEEAAKEIVTEAEDEPARAPVSSVRPKTRPSRPDPKQADAAKPATPKDDMRSAIEKAVADAANDNKPAPADTPAAPAGPPLTAGEKDALRVAVQRCWNTGSLSSDALRTTVVVNVRLSEEGKPDVGSIRMVSSSGGSSDSARQAFEAARRAIIRCGATGFNLPKDKYAQWRDIEMTFNPEKMRIK